MQQPEQLDLFTGQRAGEYAVPTDGRAPGVCRSCGANVIWTTTDAGRPIPLSLATVETRGGVKYALSHFADCPQAKDWSRKK